MDNLQLIPYFQGYQPAMLDRLASLVGYESPSTDKLLLDRLARFLAERLSSVGAEVTILANAAGGEHVRASFTTPGTIAGNRPTLVLCHYDTVWPAGTLAARPFRVEEGLAYGPGVYDMKASLVLVEFALRALRDLKVALPRPVVVLLTSDEETGSATSRALIEAQALQSSAVLVMEPPLPDGALKTARKGVGRFSIEIAGRSAHAGVEPEQGASAISELAHQIRAIDALSDPARGTSTNVGVVQGGTRRNVVAAAARMEIDARAWTRAEAERVTAAILGARPVLPGVTLTASGGFDRPPMERGPATIGLFERARAVAARLGLTLAEGATGGGSDGNFTAALGVPTLDGLGTPGAGAHADHEQIDITALPVRAALLAALLMQL